MKDFKKRVNAVFFDCMFKDAAETESFAPVESEGVVVNVGFHPERLTGNSEVIKGLIREIVQEPFYKGAGGGYTFAELPFDREGEQWGEQRDAEQLFLLAQALKLAAFCAPRAWWGMLPYGLPYIVFERV